MPLLIQSLSCEEQTLQQSTLQTMYSLVLDAPEIVTRHVTSLVPMFLGLSKFQLSMVSGTPGGGIPCTTSRIIHCLLTKLHLGLVYLDLRRRMKKRQGPVIKRSLASMRSKRFRTVSEQRTRNVSQRLHEKWGE